MGVATNPLDDPQSVGADVVTDDAVRVTDDVGAVLGSPAGAVLGSPASAVLGSPASAVADLATTDVPDGWPGLVDVPASPVDDARTIEASDRRPADEATGPDSQVAVWSTGPWYDGGEPGVPGETVAVAAGSGWETVADADVDASWAPTQFDTEASSEELGAAVPSPAGLAGEVADEVAEPLSIHSLLFGADVPLVVDEADHAYETEVASDLHVVTASESAPDGWAGAAGTSEAPPATDAGTLKDTEMIPVEAPVAPPFVLIPPGCAIEVPPLGAPEPIASVAPVAAPEPIASVAPVVADAAVPTRGDVGPDPAPRAESTHDPTPAGANPTEHAAPATSRMHVAETGTTKPEATSARAKKNADLFKGGPEFPDIFKLAMEGTSIGSNVSVRYDAASPRAKEAASGASKGTAPVPDDRAGKRRRRRDGR